MGKSSRIFRLCVSGALCMSVGTCTDQSPAPPEVQQAVASQLAIGMLTDFYNCAVPKIAPIVGSGAFHLHPNIIREMGVKDGLPSDIGGSIRVETVQPDYISGKAAIMVTELDIETGKSAKYHWNYVGPIHEARHNRLVAETVSCLHAHGPMV